MTGFNDAGSLTRRDFLQGGLAAAGTILASSVNKTASAQSSAKRPNLVFFLGEGQRADAVGIAGNHLLKTPNHDRIGHEGMRFTNAFCTNALCAPARSVALTGLYSKTSGALDNHVQAPMPSDIPFFTDLLHQAGYEVALVGKAHVGNGAKERYWDYYFGFNAPNTDYYSPRFFEGRKGVVGEEKVYRKYADDLATDRALAWLSEKREKPFCLLLWFQTPHSPFYRPRRHLDLYNGAPIPKPVTFDDDLKSYPGKPKAFAENGYKVGTAVSTGDVRSVEELVKDYYAGLVAVDDNMGRVLQHLENAGELEDTAILQTSDHGFFLGEWRLYDKRMMHEPSIRVPMMLRYPKRIKAGTVRKEMILDIDIAPTLLDLAGVEIPAHMPGKSLLSLADAPDPNWRKEWFYEYYEWPALVRPNRGVRTERYKLIQWEADPPQYEMYDLASDPEERHNLYGNPQYSALQRDLWKRFRTLQSEIPASSTRGAA